MAPKKYGYPVDGDMPILQGMSPSHTGIDVAGLKRGASVYMPVTGKITDAGGFGANSFLGFAWYGKAYRGIQGDDGHWYLIAHCDHFNKKAAKGKRTARGTRIAVTATEAHPKGSPIKGVPAVHISVATQRTNWRSHLVDPVKHFENVRARAIKCKAITKEAVGSNPSRKTLTKYVNGITAGKLDYDDLKKYLRTKARYKARKKLKLVAW